MARTNIGEQGGFLDDRQFVDALKVMYFMGAFFGALGYLESVDGALPKLMDKVTALFSIPGVAGGGAKQAADNAIRTWEENKENIEKIRKLPIPPAWQTAIDVMNVDPAIRERVQAGVESVGAGQIPAYGTAKLLMDVDPAIRERVQAGVESVGAGQIPAYGTAKLLMDEYNTLKKKYDNMSRFNPLRIVLSRQLTNLRAVLRKMGVKI